MAARLRKTVILALTVAGLAQGGAAELITGADLSMLQYLQDHGVEYKEAGQTKDPLLIFKDHGCSCVRLRLFVAPNGNDGQVNTLSYTLRLAKRVKQAGLMFLLDLHFSDGWADPGHQAVPAEWAGLSHPQLVERVFAYTRESLAAFRREGCGLLVINPPWRFADALQALLPVLAKRLRVDAGAAARCGWLVPEA